MPNPTQIKLHQKSGILDLTFDDGIEGSLRDEYLRVYSPSAEVKGHGPGQETLQVGKENVGIQHIEPVGQYAVRITFGDGHNSGLYTWDYLYELLTQHDTLWPDYLQRLKAAGHQRKTDSQETSSAKVGHYKPE